MAPHQDVIRDFMNREVVIDMASQYVYAGTLVAEDPAYLVLENADVHDLRDTNTTRELYVVDTRRYGVRVNRKRVLVRKGDVVSISLLEDIEV